MLGIEEKRVIYRRYTDRRVALMLAVHEILFDTQPGRERERLVLEAIRNNYTVDLAALVGSQHQSPQKISITATAGDWGFDPNGKSLNGSGISMLWSLQEAAPGALTLTRVKRPSTVSFDAWENLWSEAMGIPAMSLLSVPIAPKQGPRSILWLLQVSYSREWSSRDRNLAEEVVMLLARARDKAIAGN